MWYTDLVNNNREGDDTVADGQQGLVGTFKHFREFWAVARSDNEGEVNAERYSAEVLDPHRLPLPLELGMTAHEHTDLVFLATLASKSIPFEATKRELEKHHQTTTLSEDKIRSSRSALGLEELQALHAQLQKNQPSREAVANLTRLELVRMLDTMVKEHGWKPFGVQQSVEALKMESTPAGHKVDEERKSKAANMVLDPGKGQRRF